MNDMSQVIIPKSDQISADDFLAGPRTFRIEGVDIRAGTEQPVSIHLDGEDRVWRPCKSMSRVLVAAWGPDANVYKGRSVTLYRDPKVKWGGMEIGGIRVSHLSHIDREMLLQLTATKGKRAPHIVKPLPTGGQTDQRQQTQGADPAMKWATAYQCAVADAADVEALNAFANGKALKLAELAKARPDLHQACVEALDARRHAFAKSPFDDDDDEPQAGKPDTDREERFNGTDEADGDVIDQLAANAKDAPPWRQAITAAINGAEAAQTLAELKQVETEFDKHRVAVPDEAAQRVDKLIGARRKALRQLP